MKQYEITIISKEEKTAKDKLASKEIEDLGGKVLKTDPLGQKQFAYPIKKEKAGFYSVSLFEINPEKLFDLNKTLSLNDDILRYLIIAYKEMKETPKPKKKEKLLPTKPLMKKEEVKEKITETPEKEEEIKVPKPKITKKELPVKVEETDDKERLKALDKKLDELLKE